MNIYSIRYLLTHKSVKIAHRFFGEWLASSLLIIIFFLTGLFLFLGTHQGLSAERITAAQNSTEKSPALKGDPRKEFTTEKYTYERTSDLKNLNNALASAEKANKEYDAKQNSDVCDTKSICFQTKLNQLSLVLDVNKWLQLVTERLEKEKWVPSIKTEQELVKIQQGEWLLELQKSLNKLPIKETIQRLTTSPEDIEIIYAQINYAQSLLSMQSSPSSWNLDKPLWLDIDKLLAEAVGASRRTGNNQAEAYALFYWANFYEKFGEALIRSKTLPNQGKTLPNQGNLICRSGSFSCAQTLTERALEIISDNDLTILPDRQNSKGAWEIPNPVTDNQWQWQRIAYQALWQSGRIQKNLKAYEQSVAILGAMRKTLQSSDSDIQFSFRDQVQPVYREYVSLLLQPGNDSPENLKKARDLIEALQLAELENFLGCDLPITKSADNLANEDLSAAIVYPIILPDRVEVIVSLPTSDPQKRDLKHYSTSIPEQEAGQIQQEAGQIKQEAGQILRELRYRLELPYVSSRTKDLSKQVFKWIIKEEFWESLNIKTLLFIPDGLLRNIPMAALEDSEGHYLIEKYAVAVSPRLQLLVAGRKPSRHSKALLAALTEKPKDQDFGKLEYARKEVEAAEEIIGKSKRLIGNDFTRFNLENELKKGVSIVHLATHGEFNFDKNKTFLLTGDSSPKIYLQELEDLFRKSKNPIDLLVLSACETATGDDRDTLGIAGMTVRTRAQSAIASLWSIDDPATALFMKQFYKELTSGKTKAQALRKSMLAMLGKSDDDQKNKHYRDNNFAYTPSQWASYVLVGDWR